MPPELELKKKINEANNKLQEDQGWYIELFKENIRGGDDKTQAHEEALRYMTLDRSVYDTRGGDTTAQRVLPTTWEAHQRQLSPAKFRAEHATRSQKTLAILTE